MLEIKGVKKSYGEFQLDCSLNVEKGRITGLVGENGAGKSTLFKAMLGLISYDGGEIKIMGKTPEQLGEKEKEELGVVLAEAGFSGYLKGKDVEAVLARLIRTQTQSILIFQEGSHNYDLNRLIKPLYDGPVNLALKTGKKIVPVALVFDFLKKRQYNYKKRVASKRKSSLPATRFCFAKSKYRHEKVCSVSA